MASWRSDPLVRAGGGLWRWQRRIGGQHPRADAIPHADPDAHSDSDADSHPHSDTHTHAHPNTHAHSDANTDSISWHQNAQS